MWIDNFILLVSIGIVVSEVIAGGFDRTMSEGVTSLGYRIVYGEEDMMKINEVVNDAEKTHGLKSKININQAAPPLPTQDVKCLMSSDSYCTKDMYKIKRLVALVLPDIKVYNVEALTKKYNVEGVLFQAMKNDCAKCTAKEKDKAGKIVASMMAHDPAAWKMFLTRYSHHQKVERIMGYALLTLVKDTTPKQEEEPRLRPVGSPQEIRDSENRMLSPGATVRVKRYVMEKY